MRRTDPLEAHGFNTLGQPQESRLNISRQRSYLSVNDGSEGRNGPGCLFLNFITPAVNENS